MFATPTLSKYSGVATGGHRGHVTPNPIRPGHGNRRDPRRNFFKVGGGEKVVGPNVMLDNYILRCVVSCNLFFFSACSDVNCLIIPDAEKNLAPSVYTLLE